MSANLNSFINSASSIVSTATSTINTVRSFASSTGALVAGVKNLGSLLRSDGIKSAMAGQGAASAATATFSSGEIDWRVKLSIPAIPEYTGSPILKPLMETGGFVFPYTPGIVISHSANYQSLDPVHNNYPFVSYQNSKVDDITITGDFICEDPSEAAYWLAAVHFLRTVTKMNYGGGDTTPNSNVGSPPPVIKLSGYGDHVFPNVPVVVKSFSVDMSKDVDYISAYVNTFEQGVTSEQDRMLSAQTEGMGYDSAVSQKYMLAAQTSGMGDLQSYAPVKSVITVTLTPTYSREQVRKFNLNSFVSGKYMKDGGFI